MESTQLLGLIPAWIPNNTGGFLSSSFFFFFGPLCAACRISNSQARIELSRSAVLTTDHQGSSTIDFLCSQQCCCPRACCLPVSWLPTVSISCPPLGCVGWLLGGAGRGLDKASLFFPFPQLCMALPCLTEQGTPEAGPAFGGRCAWAWRLRPLVELLASHTETLSPSDHSVHCSRPGPTLLILLIDCQDQPDSLLKNTLAFRVTGAKRVFNQR